MILFWTVVLANLFTLGIVILIFVVGALIMFNSEQRERKDMEETKKEYGDIPDLIHTNKEPLPGCHI